MVETETENRGTFARIMDHIWRFKAEELAAIKPEKLSAELGLDHQEAIQLIPQAIEARLKILTPSPYVVVEDGSWKPETAMEKFMIQLQSGELSLEEVKEYFTRQTETPWVQSSEVISRAFHSFELLISSKSRRHLQDTASILQEILAGSFEDVKKTFYIDGIGPDSFKVIKWALQAMLATDQQLLD